MAAFLLFFAATPSFILSGLKMQKAGTNLKLAFWKKMSLGILGGIAGEVMSIAMYWLADSSWCRDMSSQGSYCDGQGPMVLVYTVPLSAILGSCDSMLWTCCSVAMPSNRSWASIFSYRGNNKALNVGFAIAVQIAYWTLFAFAVYLVTRNLL